LLQARFNPLKQEREILSLKAANFMPAISVEELTSGAIVKLFYQGAKVVILKDVRILEVWKEICERKVNEDKVNPNLNIPLFSDSIFDMSENHFQGNMCLGDMARFTPGAFAHIARKVSIYPSITQGEMEKFPVSYSNGSGTFIYSEEVLGKVWRIMSEVVASMFPAPNGLPNYAVNIEVLRYPKSVKELKSIFSLIEDSSGIWSRVGHQLDGHKGNAKGMFNHRIVRDCFALGSLIPCLRVLLNYLNQFFCTHAENMLPENTVVIGGDHIDGGKFFSCLTGERENVVTQIYADGKWLDLPLDSQSVAIFPGGQIARINQMSPTRHRILMREFPDPSGDKENISLILSAMPR
jgi:hypothetical protein